MKKVRGISAFEVMRKLVIVGPPLLLEKGHWSGQFHTLENMVRLMCSVLR